MGFEDKVRRVPAWCAIFVYHVVTKCNFNTDGTEKKDLHSKLPGKQKGLSYSPMPEIALLLSSPSMILISSTDGGSWLAESKATCVQHSAKGGWLWRVAEWQRIRSLEGI